MFRKAPKTKLETQIEFILSQAGAPAHEIKRCLIWAFGQNYMREPVYPNWVDNWHRLHPQAFHIGPRDKFVELIYVIGFYYEMQKRKGQGTHAVKVG
jgi:hypothetical protein